MLYSPGGADRPLGRVGSHERGDRDRGISRTRRGPGQGWPGRAGRVVIDGRDAEALDEAADASGPQARPGRRSSRVAGDMTDADHRHELVEAAFDAGRARPPRQQRGNARGLPAASARRLPAGRAARRLRGQRGGAPRSRPGRPAAPARLAPAPPRRHHLGRRRRGLRGLGRLRRRQGRTGPTGRGPGGRGAGAHGVVGRSWRPAHRHAPGCVPRRGHLGPARTGQRRARLPRAHRRATARAGATAPPNSGDRSGGDGHERADGRTLRHACPNCTPSPSPATRARGALAARGPGHDP